PSFGYNVPVTPYYPGQLYTAPAIPNGVQAAPVYTYSNMNPPPAPLNGPSVGPPPGFAGCTAPLLPTPNLATEQAAPIQSQPIQTAPVYPNQNNQMIPSMNVSRRVGPPPGFVTPHEPL